MSDQQNEYVISPMAPGSAACKLMTVNRGGHKEPPHRMERRDDPGRSDFTVSSDFSSGASHGNRRASHSPPQIDATPLPGRGVSKNLSHAPGQVRFVLIGPGSEPEEVGPASHLLPGTDALPGWGGVVRNRGPGIAAPSRQRSQHRGRTERGGWIVAIRGCGNSSASFVRQAGRESAVLGCTYNQTG